MSFGQRGEVQDPNDVPDANDVFALVGFAAAAEDANGLTTTTGGQGGETIVVTTGEDLNTVLKARRDKYFDQNFPPLIIIIEGTLTFPRDRMMGVKETYNLSILGDGNDAIIEGFGLNIDKSFNIIVRNIEFRNCPDDAINIEGTKSHHIWIDHCTLSDSPDIDFGGERHDGLLDIKDGASFITVSWNHFYNHRKTCLLGHSDDNGAVDIGRLKVTYHHNWFDNTYSRHPRVRFGECHVFNNYYDNSHGGMGYGVASTQEADVVIEANYFKNVAHPTYCGYGASSPGDIVEFDNIYFSSGVPETRGDAFEPSIYYDYVPDDAFDIPLLVTTGAGAGKINIEDSLEQKKSRIAQLISEYFGFIFSVEVRGPLTIEEVEQESLDELANSGRDDIPMVPFGFINDYWNEFKSKYQDGDEIYFFTSDQTSWRALYGREGYVLIRDDRIIDMIITCLS